MTKDGPLTVGMTKDETTKDWMTGLQMTSAEITVK